MAQTSTPFQQRVYHALMLIPQGKVTTYAELARHLGIRSPRAIGQALKANPEAPQVPCHRIIRSDGTIGGYQGGTQGSKLNQKISLLQQEGIAFSGDGKLLETDRIFRFGRQPGKR